MRAIKYRPHVSNTREGIRKMRKENMRNNEEKLLRDIQYEINCYLTTGQLNSLLFILFLIPR